VVQALGKFGRISQARSLPCQWKGNQARLAIVRPEYFDVRFGTKRTFLTARRMSALGGKADIADRHFNACA
jgi:hypothetical protein